MEAAIDLFFFNQVLDETDKADALVENAVRSFGAKMSLQPIYAKLMKTRPQHTAIPGARTVTNETSLADKHGLPRPGEYSGGAQTAEARTNDEHIYFGRQLAGFF